MIEWKGLLIFKLEGKPLKRPTEKEWRAAPEQGETGLISYVHVQLVYLAYFEKINELRGA
jgi:hypothetical protein